MNLVTVKGMETAWGGSTIEENFSILLPYPNALGAVIKGVQEIKFCCSKILQLLTGGAN